MKSPGKNGKAKRTTVEVVYLVCSLPMEQAQPEQVAAWVQGHWGIENRLHWVRDVVFDEDRHQLRTRNGPEIMAALRNLAIGLIRLVHGPAPVSPRPPDPCHDAQNEPSSSSPSQAPDPTLPTP